MLKIRQAYKIFEVEDGDIKNLFRGIKGSRTLKRGIWHHAETKLGRDGGNNNWYLTGIHCLETREDAEEYLTHFRVPRNRVIVPVLIRGDRRKPTNSKVILADSLMIPA